MALLFLSPDDPAEAWRAELQARMPDLDDRPWPERPVFGQVRYMNASGLEPKFDMAAYLRAVDDLVEAERR